jgi:hypothetical protein
MFTQRKSTGRDRSIAQGRPRTVGARPRRVRFESARRRRFLFYVGAHGCPGCDALRLDPLIHLFAMYAQVARAGDPDAHLLALDPQHGDRDVVSILMRSPTPGE